MQFIKNFFKEDETVIGLCGLKKQKQFITINIPPQYKKTSLRDVPRDLIFQ